MAEFPSLGKRCNAKMCQQLDFLPFECTYCKQIFCLDHRSVDAHACVEASKHNVLESVHVVDSSSGPTCEFVDCNRSLNSVTVDCDNCHGKFCLQHRHPFDHKCAVAAPNVVLEETKSKAAQMVEEIKKEMQTSSSSTSAQPKPISAKNAATAAKVALMKLKQTAVGDPGKVPEEERFYLKLQLPSGYTWKNTTDLPILYSKTWSIGKCIDVAANTAGLKNENNKQGVKKLRLMLPSGRVCEMDENLRKLEESGDLISGGNAALIYE